MMLSQSNIILSAIFILLQITGNLAQTANENVDQTSHEQPISPHNSAPAVTDDSNNHFPSGPVHSGVMDSDYPPAIPSDHRFSKQVMYMPFYDHPSMPVDHLRTEESLYHSKHPPHYYMKSYLPPSAQMFPQKELINMHVPHRPESKRSLETNSYGANYNYPESFTAMKHFAPSAAPRDGYHHRQVESGTHFSSSMSTAPGNFEPYASSGHYPPSPPQQQFHHPPAQQQSGLSEEQSSQHASSPQADSTSTSSDSSPSIVSSAGAGANLDSLPPQVKEFMEMIPHILSSHENGPVSRFTRYVPHSPLMPHVPLLRSAFPKVPLAHRARRQQYYYY